MARNTFRVYPDEETMLKVYSRRLKIADKKFEKEEPRRRGFISRYQNEPLITQETSSGHLVNVTDGLSNIDTIYASMTAVDVEFLCKSRGRGTEAQAIISTNALNEAWEESHGVEECAPAVKEALLVDYGVVKVYYDYAEASDEEEYTAEELEELIAEAVRATGASIDEVRRELEADPGALLKTTNIVLRDRVCVDYVPWDQVRFDPSAKRPRDVRWVAQYTPMPLEEVKFNPEWRSFVLDRYGETEGKRKLDDLQADTNKSYNLEGEYADLIAIGDIGDNTDDAVVTVVEMWDMETGLITVFPKDNEELVLHQRMNPLMLNANPEDRSPFKLLTVRDNPDGLFGIGDMRAIEPSLKELDEYHTNVATYVARAVPKLAGPKGALTQKGKTALRSREAGEYVELDGTYTWQDIGEIRPPELPTEAFHMIDKVKANIKEATGADEQFRGIFTSKRQSATESKIVDDKGERRQSEKRLALEKWFKSIGRTMLQLMQLFYDSDRMTRFTDDLGQEFVWNWSKEDIAQEADIRISLTPREDLTRTDRVGRAYQMLNMVLPFPETDRNEAFRWFYREAGLTEEEIRHLVKSQQEVSAQQQADTVQALATSVAPQAGAPGLSIRNLPTQGR